MGHLWYSITYKFASVLFDSFYKQFYNALLLKIDLANFVSLIELSSVALLITEKYFPLSLELNMA